jgi:high-affinity iron transporter
VAPRTIVRVLVTTAVLLAAAVLLALHPPVGPDGTLSGQPAAVAGLNIAVLVFREGLECILVLAAITANMAGARQMYQRSVIAGAGIACLATLATWRVAIGIVGDLSENLPALQVQAITGLLAIIVLLLVMNWFFHKVYWTGWISLHSRKKEDLLRSAADSGSLDARAWWGLALLGFTSLYREGFEVVLFLQSYRLRWGNATVAYGVVVGLLLTAVVAVLTFVAHRRLAYRKMLVLTGVLLGVVLLVMVGEQAQEMQLAGWLPQTEIGWLAAVTPPWMGVWFSVFPTVETLTVQAVAAVLVLGSYVIARPKTGGRGSGPVRRAPALRQEPVDGQ